MCKLCEKSWVCAQLFRARIWKKLEFACFKKRPKGDIWRSKSKRGHGIFLYSGFLRPITYVQYPILSKSSFAFAHAKKYFFEKSVCFFGMKPIFKNILSIVQDRKTLKQYVHKTMEFVNGFWPIFRGKPPFAVFYKGS